MEVTFAGLDETEDLAMGVWLNPSQVRTVMTYFQLGAKIAMLQHIICYCLPCGIYEPVALVILALSRIRRFRVGSSISHAYKVLSMLSGILIFFRVHST